MILDLELEAQSIAGMLSKEEYLLTGLSELKDEDYTDSTYRYIFQVVRKMFEAEKTINPVTVYEEVKHISGQNNVKWMSVRDAYWPGGTFEYIVDRLRECTKKRQLMTLSQKIKDEINGREESGKVIEQVEKDLFEITTETRAEPIVTPKDQAVRILDTVAKRMDQEARTKHCIYTNYKKLNYQTGGFEPGDLVIISGQTGGGKSALAQNFMKSISIVQKIPGLLINTEMSKDQLDIRWAALLSDDYAVNNTALRAGEITDQQLSELVNDINVMHKSEFYSITIPDLTVPKMISTIRRFAYQKKIRVLTIDYIGRVDTMNSDKDDWKQLLSAAKKLKTISQQLGILTFMIAQNDKAGNLAMASYMEHEADIHFHVRELTGDELNALYQQGITWWNAAIVVKKGRSMPKGIIYVRFVGEKLLFTMDETEARYYEQVDQQQQKQNRTVAVGGITGKEVTSISDRKPWQRNSQKKYHQD